MAAGISAYLHITSFAIPAIHADALVLVLVRHALAVVAVDAVAVVDRLAVDASRSGRAGARAADGAIHTRSSIAAERVAVSAQLHVAEAGVVVPDVPFVTRACVVNHSTICELCACKNIKE